MFGRLYRVYIVIQITGKNEVDIVWTLLQFPTYALKYTIRNEINLQLFILNFPNKHKLTNLIFTEITTSRSPKISAITQPNISTFQHIDLPFLWNEGWMNSLVLIVSIIVMPMSVSHL